MPKRSSRVVSCTEARSVEKAKEVLSGGEFVVAPTDTIYGILADATNPSAVKSLYKLRRPSGKPFLVLVPNLFWVQKLGLKIDRKVAKVLSGYTVSLVLLKRSRLFHWLGTDTVAVRYPRRGFIHMLLKRFCRPVVAPSANPEGKPPAEDIERAYRYFGERVSLYIDCGKLTGKPSPIVLLSDRGVRVLRSGVHSTYSLNRILSRKP